MDLNLAGRKALITGASKGIGLATARQLAAEGCDLVLVARTAETLEAARDRIRAQYNVSVAIAPLDVSQAGAAEQLAAEFPDVEILVNNAGAIPGGNIAEIDDARWRAAWDLKVFGYINMTRAFYALMQARRRGVIVNIIGVGGEKFDASYIAGSAGNASLMAFTKALGGASPDFGIRVLGINPGMIATDRLVVLLRKRAADQWGDAERWEELTRRLPFGRPGKPEEIAASVAFLASDLASYISGTIVTIDGGTVHRG